jgi:hypothetical protein
MHGGYCVSKQMPACAGGRGMRIISTYYEQRNPPRRFGPNLLTNNGT